MNQDLIGQLVDSRDRYRGEKHLGGRVYLVRDCFTAELVALKLLRRLSTTLENIDFAYEMALYHAIGNDHVVRVKDFGTAKSGSLFYTMEYAPGVPLSRLLDNFSPDRALGVIKQICQGLELAHEGVVMPQWNVGNLPVVVPHQRLHPNHVMVSEDGTVKVLNFGFISEEDAQAVYDTMITSLGGEFHYISPEQLEKKEGDCRSDVYVLGMILYEMLCGTNPYGIQIQNGLPWVIAHATMPPLPLTQRPGYDPSHWELNQIVLKCLAKKPEDRYANALSLLEALGSIAVLTFEPDPNPPQCHIFDSGSPIIAEDDGTQTVALSTSSNEPTLFDPLVSYDTSGGKTSTIGEDFNSYSTFLEELPRRKRPPILWIALTCGLIVSLIGLSVLMFQPRKSSPQQPPPDTLDRSI